jgi:hypothetical protein
VLQVGNRGDRKCSAGFVNGARTLYKEFEAEFRKKYNPYDNATDDQPLKIYNMNTHMLKIGKTPPSEGGPMSRAALIDDLIGSTFVQPQQIHTRFTSSLFLPDNEELTNDCLAQKDVEVYAHAFRHPGFLLQVQHAYETEIRETFGVNAIEIGTTTLRLTETKWNYRNKCHTIDSSPTASNSAITRSRCKSDDGKAITRIIEGNLDLLNRFADVVTSDTENLVMHEIMALESKAGLQYIRTLGEVPQCRLRLLLIRLEDSICHANIYHLHKAQAVIATGRDRLKSSGIFDDEQWESWRATHAEEQKRINEFANDLGYESMEQLCTEHDAFLTTRAESFKRQQDQAGDVRSSEQNKVENVRRAGFTGVEEFERLGTAGMSSAGYGGGSTKEQNIGSGLAAAYACYQDNLLNDHNDFFVAGESDPESFGAILIQIQGAQELGKDRRQWRKPKNEATSESTQTSEPPSESPGGAALNPVSVHVLALKTIIKAMCACKAHKTSLTKLRSESEARALREPAAATYPSRGAAAAARLPEREKRKQLVADTRTNRMKATGMTAAAVRQMVPSVSASVSESMSRADESQSSESHGYRSLAIAGGKEGGGREEGNRSRGSAILLLQAAAEQLRHSEQLHHSGLRWQ